jgi:phage-related protein
MDRPLKPIIWMGDSRQVVAGFSKDVRVAIGSELTRLQLGADPLDWKTVPAVGSGVREVRISEGGQFRVFYLTKRVDGIYVLHAFHKKTQKTPQQEITKAKARLKDI